MFLGIDGWVSQCRARLCADAGRALCEGDAGSANVALGLDVAFGEIRKAAEHALEDAGLSDVPLSDLHAGAGLAGMPLRREREELRRHPHPIASFEADTDASTACLGANGGGIRRRRLRGCL